jgi:hypothetical protein
MAVIFGEGTGYVPCVDAEEGSVNDEGPSGRPTYFVPEPCEECVCNVGNWRTESEWIVDPDYQAFDPATFGGSDIVFTTVYTESPTSTALAYGLGCPDPTTVEMLIDFTMDNGNVLNYGFDTVSDFSVSNPMTIGIGVGLIQAGVNNGKTAALVRVLNGTPRPSNQDADIVPGTLSSAPLPRTINLKGRIQFYNDGLLNARFRVWEASIAEPSTWIYDTFYVTASPNFVRLYYGGSAGIPDTHVATIHSMTVHDSQAGCG